MTTKKVIEPLLFLFWLFNMFVPYGYLPWYWAVPISIISFINVYGIVRNIEKENT